MHNPRLQADWLQLSNEIWLDIFQLLQPDPQVAEADPEIDFSEELSQFYELSEVCQKFHRLCTQQRSLRSCLFLPSFLEEDGLPGMYRWIQRRADSVQTIFAHPGSPYVEAALAVLQAHRDPSNAAPITNVHLGNPEAYNRLPGSVLLLVAQFKTVTTCTLDLDSLSFGPLDHSPTFDLYALRFMHHLVNLTLENGNFVDLGAASRLTCLSLKRSKAEASEGFPCVTSLVTLYVSHSSVECLHSEGVGACSSLQQLTCLDSYILAEIRAEHLAFGKNQVMRIPASLSKLSNLRSLNIAYMHNTAEIDMGWLSNLPSLHCITASLHVPVATFPDDLSVLSKLTKLGVGAWKGNGMITFSLDWSKFLRLCTLDLWSALKLNESFVCLAALPSLKEVFLELRSMDAVTTVQVAALAHQLGSTRPDVQLSVKSR